MRARIVIDVWREDAALCDSDLGRAAEFVRGVAEVSDIGEPDVRPWGNEPLDGLRYCYTVIKVDP